MRSAREPSGVCRGYNSDVSTMMEMNRHPFHIWLMAVMMLTSIAAYGRDDLSTLADSLPERWLYEPEATQEFPTDDQWWRLFGDPLLDSLIAEGERANFNLLQAGRRIAIARQSVAKARSAFWPSLSVSGGWNKIRQSGDENVREGDAVTVDYFSAGADMQWEIDVFGKVRKDVEMQQASYRASRADYASVSISVCAQIASSYIKLRTLQRQLEVTLDHVEEQRKVMKITEARFDTGLASMLDVSQARTVYYSTLASLSSLRTSVAVTVNALAVLTGSMPAEMAGRLSAPAALPEADMLVPASVPSDLLRRRPDVVVAEEQLAVSAAAVGVAKKDFLPVLSLAGSIGTSAHRFGDLMSRRSLTYTIAPQLSWTIFDGFARRAAVASAKEQMLASIDAYNLTLLTAVQEVDDALISYTNAVAYEQSLQKVTEAAQKAADLSLDRYKQGLDAFINVAQAQITLLQYNNEAVEARGESLTALVNLYKALGGGWSVGR